MTKQSKKETAKIRRLEEALIKIKLAETAVDARYMAYEALQELEYENTPKPFSSSDYNGQPTPSTNEEVFINDDHSNKYFNTYCCKKHWEQYWKHEDGPTADAGKYDKFVKGALSAGFTDDQVNFLEDWIINKEDTHD